LFVLWISLSLFVEFEKARGKKMDRGPPMYIVAPYDRAEVDDDEANDEDTSKPSKESSWHPSAL
jgi:hypothetical protein